MGDCTCLEGYSSTGVALSKIFVRREMLAWDVVEGWLDQCLPVDCGPLPEIRYSTRIDNYSLTNNVEMTLKYGVQARVLCDFGYHVDRYNFESFDGTFNAPLTPEG